MDRVEISLHGKIARLTTPDCSGSRSSAGDPLRARRGAGQPLVNAPAIAEGRGIELTELKEAASDDFTELIQVRLGEVEVAGTGIGSRNVPYLVGVWGQTFYMPFADHLAIFRYADQPGMIGRVGTAFGEHGVNIVSAAVGAEGAGRGSGDGADHGRRRSLTRSSTRSSTGDAFSVGRAVSL